MRRARSGLVAALLVWAALLVEGCPGPEDPEARVRAFVSEVADSAERRRWRDFREEYKPLERSVLGNLLPN